MTTGKSLVYAVCEAAEGADNTVRVLGIAWHSPSVTEAEEMRLHHRETRPLPTGHLWVLRAALLGRRARLLTLEEHDAYLDLRRELHR
jgi:hypothetical protein